MVMMMSYESTIQTAITKYLKSLAPDVWFTKVTSAPMARGVRGVPDILICYKGLFLALEVKNEKGKLSPHQEIQIDKINKSGMAFVVTSKKEVVIIFELIDLHLKDSLFLEKVYINKYVRHISLRLQDACNKEHKLYKNEQEEIEDKS